MSEHVVPVKTYVAVFLTLIVLTIATTGIAFLDLGGISLPHGHRLDFNTVAALTIAVAKMTLVILFFMHVKYGSGLTRIVIFAGFLWLAIMVAITMADELTRGWSPTPQPWSILLPFLSSLF